MTTARAKKTDIQCTMPQNVRLPNHCGMSALDCRSQMSALDCRSQMSALECRSQMSALDCRIQMSALDCMSQMSALDCRSLECLLLAFPNSYSPKLITVVKTHSHE
ncbi:hypothetical protein AVEN_67623-1 [Araneus ventricosus]|uniref:Uncharacterized protein n=1 Tax=Araneus ventricosus TaxID=182803 RepID=A0A4Y2SSK9_ARAVE|nr:hypothetical protein AVEN_67623-1 [Araneus ventricosus]